MEKFELLGLEEDAAIYNGYEEVKENVMSLKLRYESLGSSISLTGSMVDCLML